MLWNRSRPIVGLAAIVGVVAACATTITVRGSIPSIPDEPVRIVDAEFDGNHVTMRDAASGAPLMMPRFMPLHTGREGWSLSPTFEFTPHPAGFDLVATYHNDTSAPAHLGEIVLHTFTLGSRITIPDFRWAGEPVRKSFASPPAWMYAYPGNLYSPVGVLASDDHAIGVSLMYPVTEYKHNVMIYTRTRGGRAAEGEGGQGWQMRFAFSDPRGNIDNLYVPELLEPGATQSYAFAVRVTRNPDDWIRTLQPYHDYFRSTYGDVKYERRNDPVRARAISTDALQDSDNIRGWTRPWAFRPDEFGWKPWVDEILSSPQYRRSMLWAPSGLYDRGPNYPMQFVAPLQDDANLATAFDPAIGLPRVKASGMDLGLWWGHSARYADSWNPSRLDVLDPDDPEHMQYVYRELDAARAAGATMIGLDEFTHRYMHTWDAIEWLDLLKQRYPEFTFISEPKASDVLHNVAPTYYRGFVWPQTADNYDDVTRIHSPHFLADLVNPGHETWAALSWSQFERYFGAPASREKILSDIEKAARLGFIPLVHADVEFDRMPYASESWEWSIPSDMRDGDGYDGEDISSLPGDGETDGDSGHGGGSGDDTGAGTTPRLIMTTVRGIEEPREYRAARYVTRARDDTARGGSGNRTRDARPRVVTTYSRYYSRNGRGDDGDDQDGSDLVDDPGDGDAGDDAGDGDGGDDDSGDDTGDDGSDDDTGDDEPGNDDPPNDDPINDPEKD